MQEASRPTMLDRLTRPTWFAPALLALSATLSFLYADRSMPIADEGALLVAAHKILQGGVFYRDVDAYAFPGVSYLLAGVMAIFGEHLSVARAVAGIFFCLTVQGIYFCALALMDQRRAALCGLSILSLKFYAFPIYTMYFYADPSMAAAILALALFLRHRFDGASLRLVAVGVLTGLSVVTKQPTGIYLAAVFAVVLGFPSFAHGARGHKGRLSEVAAFGLGVFVVLGSMSAYFASHGTFGDMIRGGLLRPFTGYLPTGGVSFLPPLEWWNLGELVAEGPVYFPQLYADLVLQTTAPIQSVRDFWFGIGEIGSRLVYSSIPLVFAACAWLWIQAFRRLPNGESFEGREDAICEDERSLAQARFYSAAGASLAITLSAFPRTDFVHVITIYPAVILILFAISRPSRLGLGWTQFSPTRTEVRNWRTNFEAIFVAMLLVTTTTLAIRHDQTLSQRLSMTRADLWVSPRNAWLEDLVHFIESEVPEDSPLFIYGHEAHWYFLSNRYTTRSFSQLYPGMTGDDSGQKLAAMIDAERPPIIVQGVLRWPGIPQVPSYTREFKHTLNRLYEPDPQAIDDPPDPRMLRIWRLRD